MNAQRGFIALPALSLTTWALIGSAVLLAGMSVALKVQSARVASAKQETATVRGEFTAFKAGVAAIGKKAIAERDAAISRQKKEYDHAIEYWTGELAALNIKYDRLRHSAGSRPGSSVLPAVPDTARPTDDAASDQRLLDVLQHAETQTLRLIALQNWVAANKDSCGPR